MSSPAERVFITASEDLVLVRRRVREAAVATGFGQTDQVRLVTAASELITEMGGIVTGFAFVVGLGFLNGKERIAPLSDHIIVLADY